MANWTTADYAILAVAAFIAVTTLVRLMLHRRNELIQGLGEQAREAKEDKAQQELTKHN